MNVDDEIANNDWNSKDLVRASIADLQIYGGMIRFIYPFQVPFDSLIVARRCSVGLYCLVHRNLHTNG